MGGRPDMLGACRTLLGRVGAPRQRYRREAGVVREHRICPPGRTVDDRHEVEIVLVEAGDQAVTPGTGGGHLVRGRCR